MEPRIIDAIEISSTGCQSSPDRTETLAPGALPTISMNFVLADANCSFEVTSLTLSFGTTAPPVVFLPEAAARVDGSIPNTTTRFVSEDRTRTLVGQIATTYPGNFNQTANLIMIFGYQSTGRGLGMELRRVDTPLPSSEGSEEAAGESQDLGVGLRIDGATLKRTPDASSIIAIEPRLSCYEPREGNTCLGNFLEDYQFKLIAEQSDPPDQEQMEAAFGIGSRVTNVTSENIFGNGLYVLLSTPTRLPITNDPSALFWLLVKSRTRISAFEISTAGLRVF
jgi:hypothetical protein